MTGRILAVLFLVSRVAPAAEPAGFACPAPRSFHSEGDDVSLRAARENWRRPADCCGVVIDGVPLSAAGVVCWPIVEGNEIVALGWPVAIVLFDGGRIHLGEGARLKLVAHEPVIQIVSGAVSWLLPANSKQRVSALNKPLGLRRGMALLSGGKLRVVPDAPFPGFAPDLVELLRRFPYPAGALIPSDIR